MGRSTRLDWISPPLTTHSHTRTYFALPRGTLHYEAGVHTCSLPNTYSLCLPSFFSFSFPVFLYASLLFAITAREAFKGADPSGCVGGPARVGRCSRRREKLYKDLSGNGVAPDAKGCAGRAGSEVDCWVKRAAAGNAGETDVRQNATSPAACF